MVDLTWLVDGMKNAAAAQPPSQHAADDDDELKPFVVGNIYAFQATDADHALEQYHDAMRDINGVEANFFAQTPEPKDE